MLRNLIYGSILLFVLARSACGDSPSLSAAKSETAGRSLDAAALAERIDRHLHEFRESNGLSRLVLADDASFLRRVSLDLTGTLPTVAEVRDFLASTQPDKRESLVNRLLALPASSRHLATFWRRTWLPQTDTPAFAFLAASSERWIAERLQGGTSYDQIVRQLLTAPLSPTTSGKEGSLRAFMVASGQQPENLAANSARAFLGLNLDCAQCHDHPFSRWTQEQFWELAAFFTQPGTLPRVSTSHNLGPSSFMIAIPGAEQTVQAALFTGDTPAWPEAIDIDSGRRVLAGWLTSSENRYFAQNGVNRVWANLFGSGLIEPLDDLSDDNNHEHRGLLQEIARDFAATGYDLRNLTHALVLTREYQQTTEFPAVAATQPTLPSLSGTVPPERSAGETSAELQYSYRRLPVRGLTGEQLSAMIRTAAGESVPSGGNRDLSGKTFADRFRTDCPAIAQRSILQSLTLMNGELVSRATAPDSSPLLISVAGAPFLSTAEQIEVLFLATLSRSPKADELPLLVRHLEQYPPENRAQALSDILWSLINSSEFSTNH